MGATTDYRTYDSSLTINEVRKQFKQDAEDLCDECSDYEGYSGTIFESQELKVLNKVFNTLEEADDYFISLDKRSTRVVKLKDGTWVVGGCYPC